MRNMKENMGMPGEKKLGKAGRCDEYELNSVLDLFKSSSFYLKYKDTYFSDIILRKALKCNTSLHRYYGLNKMSYEEVHKLCSDILRDLIAGFAKEVNFRDEKLFLNMIFAFYIDPDSHSVREVNGIKCTADALLSIRRIYSKYGIDMRTVAEYELYRKKPIFFFPRETNGINMTRASVFGDKIDHTLYDIKMYLDADSKEQRNKCRLISAFHLPKTKAWLEEIGSFENLVDWYGIKGIFTNDDYNIYDIEKGQGKVISEYLSGYTWEWSDEYYNNLKTYIDQFMSG